MSTDGAGAKALWEVLFAVESAAPVDAVEAVTRQLMTTLGATSASFLVADLSGRAFVRLAQIPMGTPDGTRQQDDEFATVVPFDGGPQELAVRTQRIQICPERGGYVAIAPVTERGEAIGLLEVTLPTQPDATALDAISRGAHVLAFVVIAARRHTDLFEWGQRTTPFSLAAEIQRRLLPSAFTCEASAFTLSAWLEPAASIGGDTFDYSLARDVLHMSMTDAMGHGVNSALLATLGVGSLRNSRRQGMSLTDQARAANQALSTNAPGGFGFLTGLVARLDLRTAVLTIVNAGHVPPLLVRDGTVEALTLPVDRPFGMIPGESYRSTELTLRPRDRLVLLTDGMLERRTAALDLSTRLPELTDLHPREVTRALADAALAVAGPVLADDASLLVLDWHGGHATPRQTENGADTDRASATTE
ncbi:PP2C family protein-serine/threonine phosphatase [Cryptosporangium minutisporangium]|uniref:PP2C family protein-serine/threonine phosphatase n=1 Tax=Cryptosporangium minutisporangium TaxID=113569 RepID=A0ABP6TCI3_9ACTN